MTTCGALPQAQYGTMRHLHSQITCTRRSLVSLNMSGYRTSSKWSACMGVSKSGGIASVMPADHGTDWRHSMEQPLLWQGTWKQAANHSLSPALSPTWRVALLSDGSVTRHLQLMTGQMVETDALEQFDIGMETSGVPENVSVIPGPRSQREVHLNADGKVLVCATSWWNTNQISQYLGETQKPIWISLSSNRTEIYRDITLLYCGHSPDLERRFGHKGPFWGREYIFWRDREPMCLIHEIFSPELEKYLGPLGPIAA